MSRDEDVIIPPDNGPESRCGLGAPRMLPDANQVNGRNESNTESGRFRIIGFRLPKPRQPDRHRSRCPPDCFIAIAKKRHILSALFITYWFALIGYAATVRVLAAPGSSASKALGYIDRAQDIEAYCIVTSAVLLSACFGPFAIVVVPMSAVAIGLCIMEAARLSKDLHRRNERVMLSVLAGVIFLLMALHIREAWVWYKWVAHNTTGQLSEYSLPRERTQKEREMGISPRVIAD